MKRRSTALPALLLSIVTLACFARALGHEFIGLDDRLYVVDNPYVRSGLTLRGLLWAFTTEHTGNWHPLTWISHMADCELFGLRPALHHLHGLLLHALNSGLLFVVLQRYTGARWRSLLVAALFALHPLHVESVAWVAERKDLLSTLFFLLTLWAWRAHVERPRARTYAIALALFALGLMAKPMLVTLPFVLLLLDLWPLGRVRLGAAPAAAPQRPLVRLVVEKAPFFVLAGASSVVTFLVQRGAGNVSGLDALPLPARVANALVAWVGYLGKTFWPADLACFYPHPVSVPGWKVAGAALVLVLLSVLVILALRSRPYLAVGWAWYLGTLVPVIGLVQVGAQAMADRYTYMPLIGIFIAAAWGYEEVVRRWAIAPRLAGGMAALVLVVLAATTTVQLGYWKNSETLYRHALAVTGDNYTVHDLLGSVLARQGRLDEAIAEHSEALRLRPGFAQAHNNLANALALRGDLETAVRHYREALARQPGLAEASYNLAVALHRLGRVEEALAQFREAVRADPSRVDAHFNLARILERRGELDEALEHYAMAVRLDPRDTGARLALGDILLRMGRVEDAVAQYVEALRLEPGLEAARQRLEAIRRGR